MTVTDHEKPLPGADAAAPLRGLIDILSGFRRLTLALAASLPAGPPAPEDETPEAGVRLLASRLHCLVRDAVDPGIQMLEAMREEV
jgi:hypothetical protein